MAGNPSSKSDRRESARAKAAALRDEQLRREARGRRITLLSIVIGLLLVVALVGYIVVSGNKKTTVDPNAAAPPTATGVNGGIPFGSDGTAGSVNDGAINVEVYADFLCPWCARFEAANTGILDEYRVAGDITLVMHPLSMLSGGSKTAYSSRSASAFAYVTVHAPDKALAFNTILYAEQPAESGSGLSDDEIVDLAKQAGVPDDVAAASVSNEYADWAITLASQAAANAAVTGGTGQLSTPTILIDGVKYAGGPEDTEAFRAAIDAALQ
ncbi:hypothetical protein GCM10010401_05430 [Rarobacter faecitabidus]|uniref:Thioredoxin-like protein n=1 Tax=Rarobacter faecitabidus TaxID=13243 RepID=A0A542ZTW1_RARFA|nr:thioredoxin domain-containing protein [Rarobacter faecitabidus]TQL63706.1 thioredoxin-like protein [Rarobacter faecitabidus]